MDVLLQGGPMDGGTMNIIGYGTKVPLGYEYGWKFACGESALAHGMYLADGSWQDAEHDVVLSSVCLMCDLHGTHDILGGN